jgi:hypothetical protein
LTNFRISVLRKSIYHTHHNQAFSKTEP